MTLYLSLEILEILKLGIKNLIWYVLKNNKGHILH